MTMRRASLVLAMIAALVAVFAAIRPRRESSDAPSAEPTSTRSRPRTDAVAAAKSPEIGNPANGDRTVPEAQAPPESPTGIVTGRIVDVAGSVVASARIVRAHLDDAGNRCVDLAAIATTDDTGCWSLPVAADDVVDFAVTKAGMLPALHPGVSLTASACTKLGDWVLEECPSASVDAAAISGRVTDEEGRPWLHAHVECRSGGVQWTTTPDANGDYEFGQAELGRDYVVGVATDTFFEGRNLDPSTMRCVLAPAAHVDLVISERALLLLRVVDVETERPPSHLMVAQRNSPPDVPSGESYGPAFPNSTTGCLEIAAGSIPSGARLQFRSPGYDRSPWIAVAALTPGRVSDVLLRRKPASRVGTIRVRATSEDGQRVEHVSLMVRGSDVEHSSDATLFDEFEDEIAGLEGGHYELSVRADDPFGLATVVDADVVSGEVRDVAVTVRRGGTMVLSATESDGAVVCGIRARVTHANEVVDAGLGQRPWFGRVDRTYVQRADGVETNLLAPGSYDISLECDGFESRTVTFEIRRGEQTRVDVVLQRRG